MIAEILEAKPQALNEAPAEATAGSKEGWAQLWAAWTSALPWIVLIAAVSANEAWRWRWRWARLWAADNQNVRLLWAELVHRARRARQGPRPGETPEAWSERSGDTDLAWLARQVSRTRYSTNPEPDLRLLAARTRILCRRFDRNRPRIHRAAALLFPWWPA